MPKRLRLLVSVPSISFEAMTKKSSVIHKFLVPPVPFKDSTGTMDDFSQNMKDVKLGGEPWGINVPGWPLKENGIKGIAGPGKPSSELFCPNALRDKLETYCGTYDKWRPYPAIELTPYVIEIAKRFSKKRCRMFERICDVMAWDFVFYVEHSPASICHLDEEEALAITDKVLSVVLKVSNSWPGSELVVFSPYGVGRTPGFVVSNSVGADEIDSWKKMKEYIEWMN